MSPPPDTTVNEAIAVAVRAFARLGYVHAFGHVSVRTPEGVAITPTRPPLRVQAATDILEIDGDGTVVHGGPDARPLEVFLHLGIYAARHDVNAICRTHAPHASVWRAGGAVPPVRHGFGGIVATIATFDDVDLVHDAERGHRAAECLGKADALILRGNGVLTVGTTLGEAAARMWSLEERFAYDAVGRPDAPAFAEADLQARARWYPAEAERVWTWLRQLGSAAQGEAARA